MGLSFKWWPTRPSSATYAARDMSSGGGGVLVSSYCCSNTRVKKWEWVGRGVGGRVWGTFGIALEM
jgi:hypothetical protein